MSKGDNLGAFQQLVLHVLLQLDEDAYGMRVRQELSKRTDRSVSIGSIYSTLDRLQSKGFVTSRLGESTPERGGRAKRYFSVTAAGATALQRSRAPFNE